MPTMTGLSGPAMAAFPSYCSWWFLSCAPARRLSDQPWGIGIIEVSLHALVDFPFQIYSVLLLFFLVLAAMESSEATETLPAHTLPGSGFRSNAASRGDSGSPVW